MSRPVIPVRSLSTRLPDAGRIRIGVKVPMAGKDKRGRPKTRPEKIDRFRFTSQDRTALEQVAEIYGGHVTPWDEPKAAPGQHQVITDANELRIALPPDPLGNTPIYELWGGGGCERRCDGETCERITKGQDGFDLVQVDCICFRQGTLECQLKTRLSVLLPEVRFAGVWRLDTNGRNAAEELPGMVDLIRSLQDRGIIRATMRVEWRRQVIDGQTQEFAVPVLGVEQSLNELAAGQARLGALGTAQAPAGELGTGEVVGGRGSAEDHDREHSADGEGSGSPGVPSTSPETDTPGPRPLDPDDEIVDAEIVGDHDDVDRNSLAEHATTGPKRAKALRAAVVAAQEAGLPVPESFDGIDHPQLVAAALEAIGVGR